MSPLTNPIVVFDGVCNLCNSTVDFLIRRDRKAVLRFTPFQGKGADLLREFGIVEAPITVFVIHQGKLYEQSTAIVYLTRFLGYPYRFIWLFWLSGFLSFIPVEFRDMLYRLVARNRYRWFGKRETCRVPTPQERDRFL